MSDSVAMEVVGVRVELPTNTPILLLKERDGTRYLPIWIGTPEATAIALALEGIETARPLTHDLMKTLLDALGAEIERVDVTSLDEGTFYADLVIESEGEELTISARPSDAIALATRSGAPVFASKALLDEAGIEIHDDNEEAEIERFREFLDDVTPEDFEHDSTS
ncbi:MAG: bifunctional nuclease family protein [Acidimicrobiia bacterium]|jgi:bifunctional DNase/RNase|nr:bifunctional nuclease family protein [Acidimicrobiia bacterium]